MIFIVYKDNKRYTLKAKNLDEAEEIANEKYPDWQNIYIEQFDVKVYKSKYKSNE